MLRETNLVTHFGAEHPLIISPSLTFGLLDRGQSGRVSAPPEANVLVPLAMVV